MTRWQIHAATSPFPWDSSQESRSSKRLGKRKKYTYVHTRGFWTERPEGAEEKVKREGEKNCWNVETARTASYSLRYWLREIFNATRCSWQKPTYSAHVARLIPCILNELWILASGVTSRHIAMAALMPVQFSENREYFRAFCSFTRDFSWGSSRSDGRDFERKTRNCRSVNWFKLSFLTFLLFLST